MAKIMFDCKGLSTLGGFIGLKYDLKKLIRWEPVVQDPAQTSQTKWLFLSTV